MSGNEIQEYELFAGLGKKELREVERLSTAISIPAGRNVTTEGTRGRECFVVLGGSVKVERHGEDVAVIGSGGLVGEIALLDSKNHTRTATAVAMTDADVLVFSADEFRTLIAEHPTIAERIERTAVQRLVEDLAADD